MKSFKKWHSYNDLHSHKKSASAKRLCVDL